MKYLGQIKSFPGHDIYWDGRATQIIPPITAEVWGAAVKRVIARKAR